MKTIIKRMFMALICAVSFQSCIFAGNDKPITFEQLPVAAQEMINSHFAGIKIVLVTVENEILDKNYDVVFADGTSLEFDRKGAWTEIKRTVNNVPSKLIPEQISNYVTANYAGQEIKKIEKDRKEFDVTLSNGIELTFNKKFQLIDID